MSLANVDIFTADRQEAGKWTLVGEDGRELIKKKVPAGTREGAKLIYENGEFRLCPGLEAKERKELKARADALCERGKRMDNYKFFSHKECEYFPCHKTNDPENFNCLFCYCPLYALGDECGGNFTYTEKGFKDCSNCLVPHKRENYEYMTKKVLKLYEKLKKEK